MKAKKVYEFINPRDRKFKVDVGPQKIIKAEIVKFLTEYFELTEDQYTIHDDFSIDIFNNVFVNNKTLDDIPYKITLPSIVFFKDVKNIKKISGNIIANEIMIYNNMSLENIEPKEKLYLTEHDINRDINLIKKHEITELHIISCRDIDITEIANMGSLERLSVEGTTNITYNQTFKNLKMLHFDLVEIDELPKLENIDLTEIKNSIIQNTKEIIWENMDTTFFIRNHINKLPSIINKPNGAKDKWGVFRIENTRINSSVIPKMRLNKLILKENKELLKVNKNSEINLVEYTLDQRDIALEFDKIDINIKRY